MDAPTWLELVASAGSTTAKGGYKKHALLIDFFQRPFQLHMVPLVPSPFHLAPPRPFQPRDWFVVPCHEQRVQDRNLLKGILLHISIDAPSRITAGLLLQVPRNASPLSLPQAPPGRQPTLSRIQRQCYYMRSHIDPRSPPNRRLGFSPGCKSGHDLSLSLMDG
ncbi:hypothetical protein BKA70DRAFT_380643 [Coprinopsis sp. MPI-PUGE-AT-0042]|nr:hypothetical protein BKA70DRAFT_380643 [Coprinopsis sp. MPI-PUGE-AT-0042]